MSPSGPSVAIVCFPSFGGSGVIATELGIGLSSTGHQVHIVSSRPPVRWHACPRIHMHTIKSSTYPLFEHAPYTMALASKLVEIHEQTPLDIIHVHYAVPHAVGAYLARQIIGPAAPQLLVTLHGTDVTHVGNAPEHKAPLRLALTHCDGLTTPTKYLCDQAFERLDLPAHLPMKVIPNFVDTAHFTPANNNVRAHLLELIRGRNGAAHEPFLIHISNFRPVKRPLDVIDIFSQVTQELPARLLMVGDGPELEKVRQRVEQYGLEDRVYFIGAQRDVVPYLQHCDALLLPSEMESFGLVALEAMSCGVPVVASQVGGLPELVSHGKHGFLAPAGQSTQMAQDTLRILRDPTLRKEMGEQARADVERTWTRPRVVTQYSALYQELLTGADAPQTHQLSPLGALDP